VDSALRALVEAVEAGKPGPPLRILVAGGAFRGTVVPRARFLDLMEATVAGEAEENVRALLQPVRASADEHDAVSLEAPKWWSYDNRTTLEMPAVRVPFSAINAWWISGESGRQAADWFVDVGPLDLRG
jgi:hypothetical protein